MGTETTSMDLLQVLRKTLTKSPEELAYEPGCFTIDYKARRREMDTYGIDCDEVYPNIFIGDG